MKKYLILGLAVFLGVALAAAVFYYNNFVNPVASKSAEMKSRQAHTFPSSQTLYQMGLYLDLPNRILYGNNAMRLVNNSGQVIDELWFTAYPNAFTYEDETPAPASAYYDGFNPGGMEFDYFKVNGRTLAYQIQGVAVRVPLQESIEPGQPFNLEVKYRTRIPRLAYRFGSKDGVLMLSYAYPMLNVLDKNGWHKSYNSKYGDPFCLADANYLVRLNLPDGYNFVCPGVVADALAEDNGRQSFLIKAENIRDFSLAVMYDYKEISQQVEATNVKCYYPAADAGPGHGILQQSYEMISYYSDIFGSKYPYPDFKIVFVPMKGLNSCEHSGLIFLSNDLIDSFRQQGYDYFTLAHEISHQWWYALVGNDQVKEPWLDEGLANWSAYKYLAATRGMKTPASGKKIDRIYLGHELKDMKSAEDYSQIAYSGGEDFWFDLEKKVGARKLEYILKIYANDFKDNIASSEDVRTIIDQESRRDMKKFYQPWFQQ
ncbi:MAG: M1 family metallopeptidase [Deltaproteobacteria bacterium]